MTKYTICALVARSALSQAVLDARLANRYHHGMKTYKSGGMRPLRDAEKALRLF